MQRLATLLALALVALLLAANPNQLAHAATFTVTKTNDSGAGSLRQAILDANANPGLDTRGGLVCLNSAARFDKWNRAAVR